VPSLEPVVPFLEPMASPSTLMEMAPWSILLVLSLDPMAHLLPEVLVPHFTSMVMVPWSMLLVPSSDPMVALLLQVPMEVLHTS